MSNHLTNRLISSKPFARHMDRSPTAAVLVLVMMLSSGCLGLVDDIEDEVMDPVIDWLDSE